MINKKLMIISIFFVSLLAVSVVSAADNVTSDVVSVEDRNDDIIAVDNDNQSNMGDNGGDFNNFDDEYIINATYEKTLSNLADEIKSTPDGGVLNLSANYRLVSGDVRSGIVIDKKITINGNNHIINGNGYRIFKCYNGVVVLNNIIFYNAEGFGNGGAIYAECNLEINDCAFINNTATGNYGSGVGSAIYCQENVSLKNSIFKNHGYSGGIINSKSLNIINSSFYNNWCSIVASEDLYVENSIFCDNRHGAIRCNGKSIIKNSNFTNNRELNNLGYYEGGAIILNSSKIENCSFTDNTASSGGAILVNGPCEITSSKFVHNTGDFGGAIRVLKSASLNISSSVFIDNHAKNGGAILLEADNAIIQSSNFTGNIAYDDGGALECVGEYTIVDNCNFLNNSARDDGGAIYSAQTTVRNSLFANNNGVDGGAIHCFRNSTTVENCIFDNNTAINEGSAIYGANAINCSFISVTSYDTNEVVGGNKTDCIFKNNPFTPVEAEITISAANINEGETATISITINENATGDVIVSIGGKNYTVAISNSKASVNVNDLTAGNYSVEAYYLGNDYVLSGNATAVFTVVKKEAPVENITGDNSDVETNTTVPVDNSFEDNATKTNETANTNSSDGTPHPIHDVPSNTTVLVDSKITASNLKMYYNDGSYFKVQVYGTDGNVAVGESVVFKLNGKELKTVRTDANGYAKVKITSLPKTYKISATALGVTVTKKLTVKEILSLKKVKVKKSAKKLDLTATLKKVKGKYLKGKKITFKFNGKKYTVKTNKKGVAKVTLKSKDLKNLKVGKKITYQATYLKDTVKKTVKVKK